VKRALILVEGQTEERFVKQVLQPHLWTLSVHADPKILVTKQVKVGPQFKGGITSFGQVARDVPKLLGDTSASLVTTLFDLYALPNDFPGMDSAGARRGRMRARHIEKAVNDHFEDSRFCAFLMVHEFEAIAFVQPETTARALLMPDRGKVLLAERAPFESAEDINDGENSYPSQRLRNHFPSYRKAVFGPTIATFVGLSAIRADCPHFDHWLRRLERLSPGEA
jgi:hypothetical protein